MDQHVPLCDITLNIGACEELHFDFSGNCFSLKDVTSLVERLIKQSEYETEQVQLRVSRIEKEFVSMKNAMSKSMIDTNALRRKSTKQKNEVFDETLQNYEKRIKELEYLLRETYIAKSGSSRQSEEVRQEIESLEFECGQLRREANIVFLTLIEA